MAIVEPLLGTILNETAAAVIGIPLSHRGQPWEYRRAGLSYSLASELRNDVDRITLASRVESLRANLDPRKKGTVERCPNRDPDMQIAKKVAKVACEAALALCEADA